MKRIRLLIDVMIEPEDIKILQDRVEEQPPVRVVFDKGLVVLEGRFEGAQEVFGSGE